MNKTEEMLLENGYDNEDITYLVDFDFYDAIIGISSDDRVIYDYDLMVEWLIENQDLSLEEAREFLDENTLRAIHYMGSMSPIIMHHLVK